MRSFLRCAIIVPAVLLAVHGKTVQLASKLPAVTEDSGDCVRKTKDSLEGLADLHVAKDACRHVHGVMEHRFVRKQTATVGLGTALKDVRAKLSDFGSDVDLLDQAVSQRINIKLKVGVMGRKIQALLKEAKGALADVAKASSDRRKKRSLEDLADVAKRMQAATSSVKFDTLVDFPDEEIQKRCVALGKMLGVSAALDSAEEGAFATELEKIANATADVTKYNIEIKEMLREVDSKDSMIRSYNNAFNAEIGTTQARLKDVQKVASQKGGTHYYHIKGSPWNDETRKLFKLIKDLKFDDIKALYGTGSRRHFKDGNGNSLEWWHDQNETYTQRAALARQTELTDEVKARTKQHNGHITTFQKEKDALGVKIGAAREKLAAAEIAKKKPLEPTMLLLKKNNPIEYAQMNVMFSMSSLLGSTVKHLPEEETEGAVDELQRYIRLLVENTQSDSFCLEEAQGDLDSISSAVTDYTMSEIGYLAQASDKALKEVMMPRVDFSVPTGISMVQTRLESFEQPRLVDEQCSSDGQCKSTFAIS